jgi:hypothetical protein
MSYRKDVATLKYKRDLRYPHYVAPCGFSLESFEEPQFYFVRGRERKTPYQLRLKDETDKDVLVEKRRKQGWVRIYDCGHELWVKSITRS